jgi:hypothetical protein
MSVKRFIRTVRQCQPGERVSFTIACAVPGCAGGDPECSGCLDVTVEFNACVAALHSVWPKRACARPRRRGKVSTP